MTEIYPSASGETWRLLILDRSADDPKWLIAEVRTATFVKSAEINPQGTVLDWPAVAQWVTAVTGQPVTLSRIRDSLTWLVEPRDTR